MEKINKIRKILIVLCIILIIILISYVLVINLTRKEESSSTKEPHNSSESIKYEKHTSYDNLFIIETPKTWQEIENKNSLNEKAILELYNETENAYLVIVVNAKKDLNENFESYKKDVFGQKETYYKTKITKYCDVVIDNYNARYGEIYYTNSDNINTYIRAYAFETNNYYGQLILWTLASNEQIVQEEFNKISESLIEKKVDE